MNQNLLTDIANLKQAVAGQERLRPILGDVVVDTALRYLREKLNELGSQTMTRQHKQVTVLFADLCDFTRLTELSEEEQNREKMDSIVRAYFKYWRQAISEYGGVVEKFIGDAVMAVFGIPAAGEQDPENAIRAALAMQKSLKKLTSELNLDEPLQMRVGIHTGSVLITILDESANEFRAVGDTVNYASRLESNAEPDSIYISHNTYLHVRGVFDVQPIGELQLKGKKAPIQAYQIIGAKEKQFRQFTWWLMEGIDTDTVGREHELSLLQNSIWDIVYHSKKLNAVTVIGDAGYGKSRLFYEMENWLDLIEEGVRFFRGRATQQDEHRAYSMIYNIFAHRFDIRESDDSATKRSKFELGIISFLGEDKTDRADAIGHVLGISDYSDKPFIQRMTTQEDNRRYLQELCFKYMLEFFRAAATKFPIAIFLEDIHWGDDQSLAFLNVLMEENKDYPISVISVARPTLSERAPNWGKNHDNHIMVELAPLSEKYIRYLILDILRYVPELPDYLLEAITQHADGNPFFVEELIKILVENGSIIRGNPYWHINEEKLKKELDQVPTTLTGVLQARLDRLPIEERQILQMASVVGRIFWDSTIFYLAQSIGNAAKLLENLVEKRLIYKQPHSKMAGSQQFIFRHIMHQVVYNSLLRNERQNYHTKVVAWLKQQHGDRLDELAEIIADHYAKADQYEDAGHWYYRAAKQTQLKSSLSTAVEYYTAALFYLPKSTTETRILCFEGLGQVYRWQGQYEKAIKAFDQMHALAKEQNLELTQIRALIELSRMQNNQGDFLAALRCVESAENLAHEVGNKVDLARVFSQKGWVYFKLKKLNSALIFGKKALTISKEIQDYQQVAHNLNLVGTVEYIRGNYGQATLFLQKALHLFQQLQDNNGVALMWNHLGEIAQNRGDFKGATSLYQQALQLARDNENRGAQMVYLSNLGSSQIKINACAEAEENLLKVLKMQEAGSWSGRAKATSYLAEAYFCQEKYDEALASALETIHLSEQATDALLSAQQKLHVQNEQNEQEPAGIAWRVLGQLSIVNQTAIMINDRPFDTDTCFNNSLASFNQTSMEQQRAFTLEAWSTYAEKQGESNKATKRAYEAQELREKLLA